MKINNVHEFMVKTDKGDKLISNLVPGDNVYALINDKLKKVPVKEVVKVGPSPMWLVIYTDKRSTKYLSCQSIFTGNKIIKFKEVVDNIQNKDKIFTHLRQYPIINEDKCSNPRYDIYVLGACLAYGDLQDEYANLPLHSNHVCSHIINNYHTIPEKNINTSKMYFIENPAGYRLKWDDLFPINIYPNEECIDLTTFNIKDRIKFISGAFDAGEVYYEDIFKENNNKVGIINNDLKVLQYFQSVLFSLGVNSLIYTDLNLKTSNGIDLRLDIIPTRFGFPTFMHSIPNIYTRILSSDEHVNIVPRIIKPIIGNVNNWSYDLRLDYYTPLLYITSNYLLRPSI